MIKIKPDDGKPVTKVRPSVTKVAKAVTKLMGRPALHKSGADKQRAYRERKKANA